MPSLKRHPRYPASGIAWGESDPAKFRVPRPRPSPERVETPTRVEPAHRSRLVPRSAWLVVEFILIVLGALLLLWRLINS